MSEKIINEGKQISELKATYAYESGAVESVFGWAEGHEYYLKSEADKVIAKLNDEIHHLKRALINARHEVAMASGKKRSTKKNIAKYSMVLR